MIRNARGDPDFENAAKDMAENFRKSSSRLFRTVEEKAAGFDRDYNVRGNVKKFLDSAVEQYEIAEFKIKRRGSRFLTENQLDEKFQSISTTVSETIQDIDYKFRIRQKAGVLIQDLQRSWPKYQRMLKKFLETPVGSVVQVLVGIWLLLSGWAFRLMLLWLVVTPIVGYFLLSSVERIKGKCPNCGSPYNGLKDLTITCRNCRGVVWTPADRFNRNDPNVIDIDVD